MSKGHQTYAVGLRRAVLIGVLAGLLICLNAAPARADEVPRLCDLADHEISLIYVEQGALGAYDSCLALLDTLLARDRSTLEQRPWMVPSYLEARKSIAYVLTLPPEAQAALAEVDSLYYPAWDAWTGGRFVEGLELVQRQMEVRRRYLDENTIIIAQSYMEIGRFFDSLGDHSEAERAILKGLEIYSNVLGRDHPETAPALSSLGTLYADRGDFERAEPYLRENLAVIQAGYPEASNQHNHALVRLGLLYFHMGDFIRAESLLREALASNQRRYGRLHWLSATLMHNLGLLRARQGDHASAIPLLADALELRLQIIGEDHPHTIQTMNTLGMCYRNVGLAEDAEPLLRRSPALSLAAPGERASTATDLHNLAIFLANEREYAEAESLSEAAISLSRRIQGDSHPDLATLLVPRAFISMAQERWDEAEAVCQEAIEVTERAVGMRHHLSSRALTALAVCRLGQERYASAESLLVDSAEIFESVRLRAAQGFRRATFQMTPHLLLAECQLRQGRMDDVWVSAERAQGRVLADLLAVERESFARHPQAATRDSLLDLLHEQEALVAAVRADAPEAVPFRPNELDRAEADLVATEMALAKLEHEMRGENAAGTTLSPNLKDIQRSLPERGALLGWIYLKMANREFSAWAYLIGCVPRNRDSVS